MSGWDNPRFRKFNSVSGALVYVALKGDLSCFQTPSKEIPHVSIKARARSASPVKAGRSADRGKHKGTSLDHGNVPSLSD